MMNKYKDMTVGVVSIAIAAVLFIATFYIKEFTRTSLGADFVPRVTAVILAFLGAVLILRDIKANRAASALPAPEAKSAPVAKVGLTGAPAVVLNILLFGLYLVFLERIGFRILTPIYMFFQILLLTNPAKYRFGLYAVLSVVVGLVSYYMFVNFFQVMLPDGILS